MIDKAIEHLKMEAIDLSPLVIWLHIKSGIKVLYPPLNDGFMQIRSRFDLLELLTKICF